jgi:hypothetical protein
MKNMKEKTTTSSFIPIVDAITAEKEEKCHHYRTTRAATATATEQLKKTIIIAKPTLILLTQ